MSSPETGDLFCHGRFGEEEEDLFRYFGDRLYPIASRGRGCSLRSDGSYDMNTRSQELSKLEEEIKKDPAYSTDHHKWFNMTDTQLLQLLHVDTSTVTPYDFRILRLYLTQLAATQVSSVVYPQSIL